MSYSKRDWEKTVRRLAAKTEDVLFSKHALSQMKARKITMIMALDVLRKGVINREPEPDIKTGHTKCTMERYTAGMSIAVVAACESESAVQCIVVTSFVIGG